MSKIINVPIDLNYDAGVNLPEVLQSMANNIAYRAAQAIRDEGWDHPPLAMTLILKIHQGELTHREIPDSQVNQDGTGVASEETLGCIPAPFTQNRKRVIA